MDMASGLGVNLRPVHPGSADANLASYFRTEVDDRLTAERIAAALRGSPAVESAYVKPAEEPP
jgi:hypothetical protein